jgi:hypothetical protein
MQFRSLRVLVRMREPNNRNGNGNRTTKIEIMGRSSVRNSLTQFLVGRNTTCPELDELEEAQCSVARAVGGELLARRSDGEK